MIIDVDMDNVLAAWTDRVLEIFNNGVWEHVNNKKLERPFTIEDVKDFRMTLTLGQGSKEMIDRIMSSHDFWANLEPMPGAIDGVGRLIADGHRIVVCTMLPFFVDARGPAYSGKTSWLEKHMPKTFDPDKNFMTTGDKELTRAHILLDDGMHNIQAFSKTGNCPVVYRMPWNKNVGGYDSVETWDEFVEGVRIGRFVSDWDSRRKPH